MIRDNGKDTILLVGEAKGYMLVAIRDKFINVGYQANIISTSAELDSYMKMNHVISLFIYTEEGIMKDIELLSYIKQVSSEKNLVMFMAGNAEEVEKIEEIIPTNSFNRIFLRPLNVTDMIDDIYNILYRLHSKPHGKKKILVVDDSSVMLNSIKNWLGGSYQVEVTESGLTAINMMMEDRPDLVLLDYEMPVCDGRQTLKMIRSDRKLSDVPVIFLTGKDDRQSIIKVMALKPEGYMLKSLKPAEIKQKVDDFFEKNM